MKHYTIFVFDSSGLEYILMLLNGLKSTPILYSPIAGGDEINNLYFLDLLVLLSLFSA